jgi:hypothetical protein
MTLSELADYVCAKIGQTDEESLRACRGFLNARQRMIWDGAEWKETLCLVAMSTAPRSPWLVLPVGIDRVVKVRSGANATLPHFDAASVFDYAPAVFEQAGEPIGFMVFAPVVLGPFTGLVDTFLSFDTNSASIQDDEGKLATVELERVNGTRVIRTVANSQGNGWPVPDISLFVVRFEKEPTLGSYSIIYSSTLATDYLDGSVTHYPRCQRIRLLQTPTSASPVLALCKRACPEWTHDFETPPLPNAENALAAFATADMLERQRQYAKAQLKAQEGQAQLQIMLDLERNQSANESRIIPADIHGSPVESGASFGANGKGIW